MSKRNKLILLAIAASAAIFYVLYQPSTVTITKVVDGDTLIGNNTRTIRISGIDTPELYNRYTHKKAEAGATEAKQFLSALTYNKTVLLLKDPTQASRDKYGREIRFVFDGFTNIGNKMVDYGYANVDNRRTK